MSSFPTYRITYNEGHCLRCLRCLSFLQVMKNWKDSCRSSVIDMRSYRLQCPQSSISQKTNPPISFFLFFLLVFFFPSCLLHVHIHDVTHSYVWHASFICVTCLIHMCDMPHSYVWHASFIRVTCLIHMYSLALIIRHFSHVGHTALHCNTLQHTALHCNTLHYTALHRITLYYSALHCNTLQHTALHCNTLHYTASHCNLNSTLQRTATHCNTLQHTATHCNTLQHTWNKRPTRRGHLCTVTGTVTNVTGGCNITNRQRRQEGIEYEYQKKRRVIKATCWVVIWDVPGSKQHGRSGVDDGVVWTFNKTATACSREKFPLAVGESVRRDCAGNGALA